MAWATLAAATLFPTFALDFLEAAVLAKAVQERDIEPLKPIRNPLDVLAQTLVSCAGSEQWRSDDLYRVITRAAPYHDLPREHFDLVVEMLAGRYAGTRIRDLKPRLAYGPHRRAVQARKGAVFALYTSGGTIPNRGYFTLRHADTGAMIGELDEVRMGSHRRPDVQPRQPALLIQRITHKRRAGEERTAESDGAAILARRRLQSQLLLLAPHRRVSALRERSASRTQDRDIHQRTARCGLLTTRLRKS